MLAHRMTFFAIFVHFLESNQKRKRKLKIKMTKTLKVAYRFDKAKNIETDAY